MEFSKHCFPQDPGTHIVWTFLFSFGVRVCGAFLEDENLFFRGGHELAAGEEFEGPRPRGSEVGEDHVGCVAVAEGAAAEFGSGPVER